MSVRHHKRKRPLVESDAELEPGCYSLQKFYLYETVARYYLIGKDVTGTRWRVLKIDRSDPSSLNVYEDPTVYSQKDCNELINRLSEGNQGRDGLKLVTKAYGIIGFIKFLEPYYMVLITKRRVLGKICGHSVYGIRESRLLTIPHPSVLTNVTTSSAEKRYKRLFTSTDLTRDFFYSYTYRIMWTLQRNMTSRDKHRIPYDDMFVWNSFLTRDLLRIVKSPPQWTVALVHGYFRQEKLVYEKNNFMLTLIARRSRHYAGTRYLKRGVNEKGRVANDVETEQLVHEEKDDQISSIVQHRGSIPLYWSQETSVLSPKPAIKLQKIDPTYKATELHFQNLVHRYGIPIVVLNLVKTVEKRPREAVLCREFANSVAHLNHKLPKSDRIKFIQFDLHLFAKRRYNMLEILESIAASVLDSIDFYYCTRSSENLSKSYADADNALNHQPVKNMLQHGVLRTNCIDCLDRTNVAQYAFGLTALGRQMNALGLCNTLRPGSCSNLGITLMELYEQMGDVLALQYGGSTAHNKLFLQWQGKSKATIQSQEFLRSLVRHYNNAYLDGEKQDAINIFLGHFRPELGKLDLWQLDSDNHLQFRRCGNDPENDLRNSFIRRSVSADNMLDQAVSANLEEVDPQSSTINRLASIRSSSASLSKRFSNIGEDGPRDSCESRYSDLTGGDEYFLDDDWLSTSGMSSEEEPQERHVVIKSGTDSWRSNGLMSTSESSSCQSSGFLSGSLRCDDCDDQDDNFQDLTALLIKAKSNWKEMNVENNERTSDFNDKKHNTDKQMIKAIQPNTFCEKIVNWIQEGEILCF